MADGVDAAGGAAGLLQLVTTSDGETSDGASDGACSLPGTVILPGASALPGRAAAASAGAAGPALVSHKPEPGGWSTRRKRQRLAAGLAADADSGPLQPGHPSTFSADAVLTATKADRLERNRAAAAQCRQRKKQYIKSIEDELVRLRQENAIVRTLQPIPCPHLSTSPQGPPRVHSYGVRTNSTG